MGILILWTFGLSSTKPSPIVVRPIPTDVAEKMLSLPAMFTRQTVSDCDFSREEKNSIEKIEDQARQRDSLLMDEEFVRIEARAKDIRRGFRLKIKKLEAEIRQLKKDYRLETDMKKKLDLQRQQIMLNRKLDEEESQYRQKSRAVDDEMLELNDTIRASIEAKSNTQTVFTISWSLK